MGDGLEIKRTQGKGKISCSKAGKYNKLSQKSIGWPTNGFGGQFINWFNVLASISPYARNRKQSTTKQ